MIDRTITYETISPSIFQYVEIRKLYIADMTGRYIFKIDKLRINFSLLKFFFSGKNPIDMVYFENSSVTLDTESDKNIIEIITEIIEKVVAKKNDTPSRIDKLTVAGKNISVNTTSHLGDFRLNRVFLDVTIDKTKADFLIRSNLSAENIPFKAIGDSLTADVRVEGSVDRTISKHDYNFEIKNLKSNNFNIKRQNLNIQYQDKKIIVRKVKDRAPIDLIVECDISNRIFSASARFENYSLSDSYITFQSNKKYFSLFKSRYTGAIDVIYSPNSEKNKLSYTGDITTSIDKSIFQLNNNFSLSFFGDDNFINFTKLLLETEKGTASYTGLLDLQNFLPSGTLTLNNIKYSSRGKINSQVIFTHEGRNNLRASLQFEYGNKVINKAELKLSHNNKRYSFQLSVKTEEGGAISYSGLFSNTEKQYLESVLVFEDFGLDYIAEIFLPNIFSGRKNMINGFSLDASVKIATNFKDYNISSNNIKIYEVADDSNYVTTSLNIDDKYISVGDAIFNLQAYKGAGKFVINKTRQSQYDLDSQLILNNQVYNLSGNIYPGSGIIITGNYNVYFSLFQSKDKELFSVFSEKLPILLPDNTSYLSLRVSGYKDNNGNSKVFVRNNAITGIKTLHSTADLSLSCYIINNSIRINRIIYTDIFSRITGVGDVFIKNNQEVYGWAYLSDQGNSEKYSLNIDVEKDFFTASMNFSNSLVQRITGQQTSGKLSGQLVYKNHIGFPELTVTASSKDTLLFGNNFLLDLDLYASYKEILINKFELEYASNKIINGKGYVNRVNRDYHFTSKFLSQRSATANLFESDIIINGELSKTNYSNNLFDISLSQFINGSLLLSNVKDNVLSYDYWLLSFVNTEAYFSISGGPENSISAYWEKTGMFNLSLKQPFPLIGVLNGTIKEGNIDAAFSNISLNLDIIGKILSHSFFNPIGGVLRGSINISGKLNDPDFFGELYLQSVEAISSITPQVIGPFETYTLFQGKRFFIPETLVKMQKSMVYFKLDAIMDHWIPREFILKFRTPPDKTIWIKNRFAAIDVNGYASGEISIEENNDTTMISGRVVVSKTVITLADEKEDEPEEPDIKEDTGGMIVDLEIISGSGVEFFWPTVRFPILRTSAAVGQKINIYSDRAADTFSLTGDLKIVGGEIFYFNQNFFLKEGLIVFDENENHFDPHITARAEMRERTSDNREVKISLVLDDNPLSQFSPRFESTPPLSEAEIYNLLGQGIYNQLGGENLSFGSAILGAGSYSSQLFGFLRPFETGVKNLFNLDFFSIRTQFLQRAFLYDIFRVRDENFTEDQGLNTYLDNTSIFMGKYFGQYFFLQGLVRMSTLDFDTGRYSYYDIPDLMGMYLETDISLEVDTPIAFIGFRFYPRINNFYDSLLDTTLQLSWRFSF